MTMSHSHFNPIPYHTSCVLTVNVCAYGYVGGRNVKHQSFLKHAVYFNTVKNNNSSDNRIVFITAVQGNQGHSTDDFKGKKHTYTTADKRI